LRVDGGGREVAVEGDGHVFVAADAVLDGLGVFRGMDEGLPRVNVLGLVEIAVGNEGQAFEADVVEDVVAVGDFPRVQQRREFLLVFPDPASWPSRVGRRVDFWLLFFCRREY
jgi:hypothetical protein